MKTTTTPTHADLTEVLAAMRGLLGVGDLRRLFATTNPTRTEMLAACPGLLDAATAVRHARDLTAAVKAATVAEEGFMTVLDRLGDRMAKTPATAAEILEEAHRLVTAEQTVNQALALATQLDVRAGSDLSEVVTAGADAMRARLHTLLGDLVDQARDLDAPATAEDAITTGRSSAYQQFRDLAITYGQLRQAQADLDIASAIVTDPRNTDYRLASRITNAATIFPEVGQWTRYPDGPPNADGWQTIAPTPPWPRLDAPAADWLRYYTTSPDAQPWVPSLADLHDAMREISEAGRAARLADIPRVLERSKPGDGWRAIAHAATGGTR